MVAPPLFVRGDVIFCDGTKLSVRVEVFCPRHVRVDSGECFADHVFCGFS